MEENNQNTNTGYNSFDNGEFDSTENSYQFGFDPNQDSTSESNVEQNYEGTNYTNQNYANQGYVNPTNSSQTDSNSILALVFGILSIFASCCYGIPGLIMGIVAVVLANNAAKKTFDGKKDGIAMGGFVCGLIGAIFGGIMIVLFIAAFLVSAVSGSL